MAEPKLFVATKAFIFHNGKVLILKESSAYVDGTNSGKCDLPGGRVKPGERFDAGLLREIKEETGLDVTVGKPFCVSEWRPIVRGEQWQIVGTFFECHAKTDNVVLSEDHCAYFWIDPKDYKQHGIFETNWPAFEAFLKL